MLLSRIPYRPLALMLGLFFLLFTAGLPLALTLCPMAKAVDGNACPMCANAASHSPAKEVALHNAPCCTTVTSSSTNAEFLQVRSALESVQKVPVALVVFAVPERTVNCLITRPALSEFLPTHAGDIPILTSSLLI